MGLWVEEIMNSWKLFNNFRRVVPKTVEFLETVSLSPGRIQNRFQNRPFQNRWMMTLDLQTTCSCGGQKKWAKKIVAVSEK
jgi:hypothetical protein